MTWGIVRQSRSFMTHGSGGMLRPVLPGAGGLFLLTNEAQGYAIDATVENGRVACIDRTTTANCLNDVILDRSNLTQTGTSAKLVNWNSSPFLRWTPHNLHLQSQTLDNASWTKQNASISADATSAPDGTLTADKLVENSVNTFHSANTSITTVIGFAYTFSIYVKQSGRTWLVVNFDDGIDHQISFDVANGVLGTIDAALSGSIVDAGNGWFRCAGTYTVANGTTLGCVCNLGSADNTSTYLGNGTSGLFLWGAQLNRGTVAPPYLVTTTAARVGIPQGYDVTASRFGMPIELAATNIITRSEEFNNAAWTKTGGSISANATTAPDGSSTADLFTEDTSTGAHTPNRNFTGSAAVYTTSAFVKANGRTLVNINTYDQNSDTDFHADFVLSGNGSVINPGPGATGAIMLIGNGWYRISITLTMTGTSATSNFAVKLLDASGNSSYTGNGSSGAYIWGAQIEVGTVASSYVPTVSATTIRAVDNVSNLLSSIPFNTGPGTTYTDSVFGPNLSFFANSPRIFEISDGTTANVTGSGGDLGTTSVFVASGSGATITGVIPGVVKDMRLQTAFAWNTNDFSGSGNGRPVVVDTSGALPTGLTSIVYGDRPDGTRTMLGYIYRFVYVPRRVSDADLVNWRYNY